MLSTAGTQVHLIVDDSGSMYFHPLNKGFIDSIRMEFDGLADRLEAPGLSFTCHLFSDTAHTGRRLWPMPKLSAGTNIATGFEAMVRSVTGSPCEHCIVIFVSDGEDLRGNEGRRARLPPLPCKSTLLTVAVGEGFPTSLVVNELRVKYHSFGGDSIPLVFPLSNKHSSVPEMQEEVQWVISQLEEIIRTGGVVPELSMEELGTSPDIDAIFRQCKRWYNSVTVKCISQQPTLPEKIAFVQEARNNFSQAEALMRKLTLGIAKPLPSNLRVRRPILLLSTLREKLNTLLEQLNKGRLFEQLTDVEKQEYLCFGNKAGRFLSKSIKYHAANFETTRASLIRLVANYKPTHEDEELVDQLNLCSAAEYLADAGVNPHLFKDISTLAGVLEGLPFVGRTVELHDVPDCAQINPWIVSIKRLPMLIKTISTHDLYIQYKGEMEMSGEKINSIVICGGDPACPGIFCHLQSFALTKNWLLYFNDSRLAAAAMLVVHVLGDCTLGEWTLEELSRARSICALHTPINSKWWHDYLDCMKSDDFRSCLVTESPKLGKCMTCPGLSKFLLGMWWWVDQGRVFSDLPDRFQAAAVELLGRCKLDETAFFALKRPQSAGLKADLEQDRPNPSIKALDAVMPALRASHLSMRRISSLLQSALQDHIKQANSDARKEVTVSFKADELMKVAHFNICLDTIACIFAGLMEKQGVDWAPTEEVLMRALMIATSHATSFGRNHPTSYANATREEILSAMASRMAGKVCEGIRGEIMAEAKRGAALHLNNRHLGLPCPIPYAHVRRYKEETGRDIAETWQLDPETRLSPIACCFPACDLYLTIPPGDAKKQRAVIRAHLSACCRSSIPGLHRCVARNARLPSAEILKLVQAGTELGEPFLPREVARRLAKGVGVYGGVPRAFASAEHYREYALEIEYKSMQSKLKESIKEFTGGDSIVLYHAIDDIRISMDADVWEYSCFKRTFDAKYAAIEH